MQRFILRAKIHRATVTDADIHYVGSITIDEDLMDAAGLVEFEQVHVAGLSGGERLVTYVIKGARGSGDIKMNGAAALLVKKGERVIVLAYGLAEESELAALQPRLVFVDERNRIVSQDEASAQADGAH